MYRLSRTSKIRDRTSECPSDKSISAILIFGILVFPITARTKTIYPVCEEGLGMVDIYAYVNAMKLMWIRKTLDSMQIFKCKNLLYSVYPDFNNIANFGNSYPVILMESVKNSFWKDCLDAFRSFAHNIHSSSFDEFLTEPIFYNPYILIDKTPFYNSISERYFSNNRRF